MARGSSDEACHERARGAATVAYRTGTSTGLRFQIQEMCAAPAKVAMMMIEPLPRLKRPDEVKRGLERAARKGLN